MTQADVLKMIADAAMKTAQDITERCDSRHKNDPDEDASRPSKHIISDAIDYSIASAMGMLSERLSAEAEEEETERIIKKEKKR